MDDERDTSAHLNENTEGLENGDTIPPEELNKQDQQKHSHIYGDPGRKPWVSCVIRGV